MAERVQCEFSLIRYVPDVVKGEFANIGVVLREPGGNVAVRFTKDWARVRCMDAGADVGLLEALESELAERVSVATAAGGKTLWELMEDSLSNSVQLTEMRGTLAESLPAEMEQLMQLYVEPLKVAAGKKKQSGRAAIAGVMREQFERAGVWRLMRKRIAASEYTQKGDPLRIDCGYRSGAEFGERLRMFQAVSLDGDGEMAKGMAYSAAAMRDGVRRVEGTELEWTAVIEPVAAVSDEELYRFGVSVMESEGLRVLTTSDMGRVAETARRELRV